MSATDAPWPSVTVIVPSYRHARFVSDALDSIIATEYPNLEIVIINDASPDNDDEVIRAWLAENPGARARYILHEHNQGLTKTLNEAIDVASGEYITLLAADDLMLPNGIHDRVRYLLEHPDKLAVFADCHVVDQCGVQIYESGIEELHPLAGMKKNNLAISALIPYSIVFHWAVPGPVFMCQKSLFDIVGHYDENLAVEDWDMYIRAAGHNLLGFVNEFVASYRIHSSSFTQDKSESRRQSFGDSFYKMHRKNLTLFHGVIRWRIRTCMLGYERKNSSSKGLAKIFTELKFRLLATLSYRGYLLRRFQLRLSKRILRRF